MVQGMVYLDSFNPHACILRCASINHQPCELVNVVPFLNATILLHLETPLFSSILGCDMMLLVYPIRKNGNSNDSFHNNLFISPSVYSPYKKIIAM